MTDSAKPSPQEREDALFALAIEKPSAERAAFLQAVCGDDRALRQRLEALLAGHDRTGGWLEETGDEPAAKATLKIGTMAVEPDETVGQTLGRYKLLERIGEGGCGVVYVAEQTEPIRRRVALKVIKLGMDTKQVVARFEAERQALAMMDHPNIAKVLDAGSTESPLTPSLSPDGGEGSRRPGEGALSAGRPYFVMELVRGVRITDYCDQANLSTRERLELFTKVCQAIQHAHQKGIIHRDIKPSNILVTLHDGVPVPKVIDFGIAKATEGRLTDATVYTQLHQFIGTPAYMSPEQAEMSGLDIDTRSDIYSLGVLLYELLTGKPPFDPKELMEAGIDAMRRTIREKVPLRPSTQLATLGAADLTTAARRRSAESSKLVQQVRGDLDWIVLKCLEKDRSRRYETANGLAADVRRHLENEPVVARPPSRLYEFQKTVQRHKFGFAAATALIIVLTAGVVTSTWQALRATRAERAQVQLRERAESNEQKAVTEAARAAQAEDLAVKESESTRQALSTSAIALAEAALREGNAPAMRAALNDVPENLRDSTWHYLMEQSDTSIAHINLGTNQINAVTAHPRLRGVFAVADDTGLVTLLNVLTGERLLEFEAGLAHNPPYVLAISPDGERIAIGSAGWSQADPGLVIHQTRDGKKLLGWNAKRSLRLEFSPDGQRLLQGEANSKATRLWDATTGQLLWTHENFNWVTDVTFTPGGQQVLVQGGSEPLQLLNGRDGSLIREIGNQNVGNGALSPDGRLVVTGDRFGVVRVVDLGDGRTAFEFRTDDLRIARLVFTADGSRFITVAESTDGRLVIQVRNAQTGALVQRLMGGRGMVNDLAVHPLSGELVVCGAETLAWSLSASESWTSQNPWTLEWANQSSLAFWGAADECLVPAGGANTALVKLEGREAANLWVSPNISADAATVSADGRLVALGQLNSMEPILLFQREGQAIGPVGSFKTLHGLACLRLSPAGTRLAAVSGQDHDALEMFSVSDGPRSVKLNISDFKRFNDVGWPSEERLLGLVTARSQRGSPGSQEQILVWDVATGAIVQTATNLSTMDVLAIAPDGRRFAEAGADKRVRIRDVATLAVLQEFRAHDGPITALAWHPKRSIVATGSTDLTIRLWDLDTGRRIEELRGPIAAPHTLAFSPDGKRLGCASLDSKTRIWNLPSLKSHPSSGVTGQKL